jgi:hypothetical protein
MTPADRIWFHPPKFWATTKNLPQEVADQMLDAVIFLAEIRDFEALRNFSFVSIGPHKSPRKSDQPEQI